MADVARPHDEVDPWRTIEEALPLLLRHAAADPDGQVAALLLQLAQTAEVRVDLLLRLIADRAGVEQDEVRLHLALHALVAAQLQAAGEALAVEIVHLTTPR